MKIDLVQNFKVQTNEKYNEFVGDTVKAVSCKLSPDQQLIFFIKLIMNAYYRLRKVKQWLEGPRKDNTPWG